MADGNSPAGNVAASASHPADAANTASSAPANASAAASSPPPAAAAVAPAQNADDAVAEGAKPAAAEAPKADATATAAVDEPAKVEEPKPADVSATDKPADAAAADGEKKPDAAAEAPKPPVYAEFKLPEGFQAEAAQIGAYTNILGKYNIPQEAGQELVDFHANELKRVTAQIDQRQRDVFSETQRSWIKDFDKAAGNRRDTLLNDAKEAVALVVKDPKARTELWNMFAFTGAGNHKANILAWAAVKKLLSERSKTPNPVPLNEKTGLSPADRRYGKRPA